MPNADYLKEYTMTTLLTDFCKYVPVNKKTLSQLFQTSEEGLNEAFKSVDLKSFNDKQLHSLEGVIFNKLNTETFDKEVPYDEVEYCWNIGLVILERCEHELTSRQPEEENQIPGSQFVRTSKPS